jgi:hypothetical protein
MMDLEALRKQGAEAIIHRLWIHTVAVVNTLRVVGTDPATGRRADAEEYGSGCALCWRDHHFILTAKHVLASGAKPGDLRIFWCPSGSLERRSNAELRKQDVVDATPLTGHASITRCGWEDLAVFEVDPKAAGQYVEFFDLAKDWIDPPEGERVHCFGFPSDKKIPWETKMISNKEERLLAIRPDAFDGLVKLSPDFSAKAFDPDLHYLIPFEDAAIGRDPHGYSGAATWWESDQHKIVWHADFKFAGTCTHSYKDGSFERVVKASVVRRFIEEVFGSV